MPNLVAIGPNYNGLSERKLRSDLRYETFSGPLVVCLDKGKVFRGQSLTPETFPLSRRIILPNLVTAKPSTKNFALL